MPSKTEKGWLPCGLFISCLNHCREDQLELPEEKQKQTFWGWPKIHHLLKLRKKRKKRLQSSQIEGQKDELYLACSLKQKEL